MINLGCPKNSVDSGRALGAMLSAGWRWAGEARAADVCLVNTCGFLAASRAEAEGVLKEVREGRTGALPVIVAMGCLAERLRGEEGVAGADVSVGFADYPSLPELCEGWVASAKAAEEGETTGMSIGGCGGARGYAGRTLPKSYMRWLDGPALLFESPASAWLKLGEGCGNHCAYCTIPMIRGDLASRPVKAVVAEARRLLGVGVRELNLVAQDTTAYGMDWDGKRHFTELLRALLAIREPFFLRVLYAHPRHLTLEALEMMGSDERVCPYLDLPLQHISDEVLRAMGRGYGRAKAETCIERFRKIFPGGALRTTFITGHPGEGGKEFGELAAFVGEGHFDHVGVFAWSPEPGTRSARRRAEAVPGEEAERRRRELLRVQKGISAARWKMRKGEETAAFPEAPLGGGVWRARSLWQAPGDLDGESEIEGLADDAGREPVAARVVRTKTYGCRMRAIPQP